MADFAAIYFIQKDAATYRAFTTDGTEVYSGTNLVTDVLDSIESDHPAGGFAIHFGVGVFDMGTDNWTITDSTDILFTGQGMGVTTIQNSTTAAADSEPLSFTRADKMTIRDMTISAGGTARSTSDALDFDDCDDVLVERVEVILSRGDGIVFDGKDSGAQALRNSIIDCHITGADLCGIQLLASDFGIVRGNYIYGNGECGLKLNRKTSVTVQNSEGNVIVGNHIHDNDESGIEILEGARTLIADNHIYNNGQGTGSDDGITIDDFGTSGLTTEKNIIVGNHIYDTQGTPTQDYGVRVADADCLDTLIGNNYFDGHLSGPVFDSGTRTRVRGNTGVSDNATQEVATAATLLFDDARSVLNVDTSGGTVAVTLPDCAASAGRGFLIRRDGGSNATVVRAGSDTFSDAATTKTLGSDGAAIGVVSVGGGEWKIVSAEGTVT